MPIARYGGHPEARALASLKDELHPLVSWGILASEHDLPEYEWEIHNVLYRALSLLRGAVTRCPAQNGGTAARTSGVGAQSDPVSLGGVGDGDRERRVRLPVVGEPLALELHEALHEGHV